MDKTRVALTAISCITVVLILFICGMSPNVGEHVRGHSTGIIRGRRRVKC